MVLKMDNNSELFISVKSMFKVIITAHIVFGLHHAICNARRKYCETLEAENERLKKELKTYKKNKK